MRAQLDADTLIDSIRPRPEVRGNAVGVDGKTVKNAVLDEAYQGNPLAVRWVLWHWFDALRRNRIPDKRASQFIEGAFERYRKDPKHLRKALGLERSRRGRPGRALSKITPDSQKNRLLSEEEYIALGERALQRANGMPDAGNAPHRFRGPAELDQSAVQEALVELKLPEQSFSTGMKALADARRKQRERDVMQYKRGDRGGFDFDAWKDEKPKIPE